MDICRCPSSRLYFGTPHCAAGKMISCKGYLLSEAELRRQARRRLVPTSLRSSKPQRKRASHNPLRRGHTFCFRMLQSMTYHCEADHVSKPIIRPIPSTKPFPCFEMSKTRGGFCKLGACSSAEVQYFHQL